MIGANPNRNSILRKRTRLPLPKCNKVMSESGLRSPSRSAWFVTRRNARLSAEGVLTNDRRQFFWAEQGENMWGRLSIAPGRVFELNDRHHGLLRCRFLIWKYRIQTFFLPRAKGESQLDIVPLPSRSDVPDHSSTSCHIRTNHGSFSFLIC